MSCSPATSCDSPSRTRRPAFAGKRHQMSVCQVTGCGIEVDENQARRLKTCEPHRRAPTVDMDGVPSRFCQQCTLIHPLNHFDGAKRGCRRRLELRNSRRQQKTALRHGPSSEPGTPTLSSGNSTPMKTDSPRPMKSPDETDSPPESPSRLPSSMNRPAKSAAPPSSPPQDQHMADIGASVPRGCDERPPLNWPGLPVSSFPVSVAATSSRFASMTPEDFENALSSMQWSQSREAGMLGRPMRGSISDGFAALSPADRLMYMRLPSLPDIPFVEDGNESADGPAGGHPRSQPHAWPSPDSRCGVDPAAGYGEYMQRARDAASPPKSKGFSQFHLLAASLQHQA